MSRNISFRMYSGSAQEEDCIGAAPDVRSDYVESTWATLLDQDLRDGSIIIDPTYYCNMSCRFCDLPIKSRTAVDLDRIRPVIQSFALAGIRRITLTGGEPGIYSRFQELVRLASESGLRVSVLTNGTWAADYDTAHQCIKAGISEIVVSIKAAEKDISESLTESKLYDKQIKALKNFSKLQSTGLLQSLVVNHVACSSSLHSILEGSWLQGLGAKPILILSLIEPYTREMIELIPSIEVIKSAFASPLSKLESLTSKVMLEGFPLCILGPNWKLSRDIERSADRSPRIFIKPSKDTDLVLLFHGYQRALQFTPATNCESCSASSYCPGVHKKLAAMWSEHLLPLA